jgi:hypothetical protein
LAYTKYDFGTVLVDLLASFIGECYDPCSCGESESLTCKEFAANWDNCLCYLASFDTLLLSGSLIYPLILGFVIIGAGISLTDGLIKSITDDHQEFRSIAGYAKFILYSIFLIIGASAIFATFDGVTNVVANISWGFAIALAVILIPVVYAMAKKISKEMA